MNLDWRWHVRLRGLLPLSPHALADDGRLLVARPDELEARRYQLLQADASGRVSEAGCLTVETVRQICLSVDASILLAVTDDDVYLFREGRKSRFLPERRASYLSVALARAGGYFTCALTDMLFAGQTVVLAEASGKVVWTKDLDAPITVVGIAPDGKVVAAGLENGRLLAFDAGRSLLWDAALDAPAVAIALTEGGRCVTATASGTVLAIDSGDPAWRIELGGSLKASDSSIWETGGVAIGSDAPGAWTAVAGGGDSEGWIVLLDREGRTAWEQTTSSRVTGVALAPSAGLMTLSQADGELLQFQVEASPLLSGIGAGGADVEFRRALAAQEAGQLAEARESLLRVLATEPGHLAACDALIALDENTCALALGEADRLAETGQFAEALARLETARAMAPGDTELPRLWVEIVQTAEAHAAGQAVEAEARGEPEQAAGHWRALLLLHPKCRRAREEIARLEGHVAESLVQEGEAALAAGREEEALAAWRRAQAAAPSEALAGRIRELEQQRYLRAGIALYSQGRFPEAAFQLRKVLALQPAHPEALRYLAYIENTGAQSPLSERFSRLE